MPGRKPALISRTLACPCCDAKTSHDFLKSRSYAPIEQDSDGHVVQYKWLVGPEDPPNPLYQFILFCPECHYADVAQDFEEGLRNPLVRRIAEKVIPALDKRHHLAAELLSKHIQYPVDDYPSAVNLHVLALIYQTLILEDVKDHYKIGRLYLRLAWLFREEKARQAESPSERAPYHSLPSYADFFDKLKKLIPETPLTEEEALGVAIPYLETALTTDAKLSDNNAYFAMIGLIIDLMVRRGDLDGAMRMVRGMYKSGADARAKLQKTVRDAEVDPVEKRKARTQLDRVADTLSRFADFRKDLVNKMMSRDKAKIQRVLKKYGGADLEVVEKAFRDNDLALEIMTRLRDKGGPLEYLNRKKGWLKK